MKCSNLQPNGSAPLLMATVAGIDVAFPLQQIETTISSQALVAVPQSSHQLVGIVFYQGNPVSVINTATFLDLPCLAPPDDQQVTFDGRVVLLRTSFGLVGALIHKLNMISEPNEQTTIINPDEMYKAQLSRVVEHPSFLHQEIPVLLFRTHNTLCGISLKELHHLQIVKKDDIIFSEELKNWVHVQAPQVPIRSLTTKGTSAQGHPINGHTGYILYVTMSNASNFGLFLDAQNNDPGKIQNVTFTALDRLSQSSCFFKAVEVTSHQQQRVFLMAPDQFFELTSGERFI